MTELLHDIEHALPRAADANETSIERRRTDAPLEQTGITLVKLNEHVRTMTRGDFEADMERGTLAQSVETLIEFWPDDANRDTSADEYDGVLRVSGTEIPNSPQYFRANLSDGIFIAGKAGYDGWAVAHAADSIHGRDKRHLEEQRLFDDEGRNRMKQLEEYADLIEAVQSEEFQQLLDHLNTLDEDEREQFLDDYFDRVSPDN